MSGAPRKSLEQLADELASGKACAAALAEEALGKIDGQLKAGVAAFIHVNPAQVKADASASDARRKAGRALSRFDGIPFGVKDLFDIAGEVTTAGSAILKNATPAARDAEVVSRLKAAGLVVLGRTNMTEFAYSGVGLNPHYGTPPSVYAAEGKRIPGGSSSGSGVAVGAGVCAVALGTDTGGSCRIPAAFNGIVGFKPTASRVSTAGVYPLSGQLDSIGPLGATVSCCLAADAIMSGQETGHAEVPAAGGLKIGVLTTYVLDGMYEHVASDFERARQALAKAGCQVSDVAFPELAGLPDLLRFGGIVAFDAWSHHGPMIEADEAAYDPRVASRIRFGAKLTGDDYAALLMRREELKQRFAEVVAGYDLIMCPTVAVMPPLISDLATEDGYRTANLLALRNTYVFNFLDGCAISLPMQRAGAAPSGLMLALPGGRDASLLAAALLVERLVSPAA